MVGDTPDRNPVRAEGSAAEASPPQEPNYTAPGAPATRDPPAWSPRRRREAARASDRASSASATAAERCQARVPFMATLERTARASQPHEQETYHLGLGSPCSGHGPRLTTRS